MSLRVSVTFSYNFFCQGIYSVANHGACAIILFEEDLTSIEIGATVLEIGAQLIFRTDKISQLVLCLDLSQRAAYIIYIQIKVKAL